jgi:hypothetical protein
VNNVRYHGARRKNMRQFKGSLGAFAVIFVLLVSQLVTASSAHAVSASYPPAGAVLVYGSQWAGSYASKGDLNVYSNGYAGNPNCPGKSGPYGSCLWQCVELAQRWSAIGLGEPDKIWPHVNIAPDMWSEGPKLPVPFQQHVNGGGGQPQFGDLLIFAGNPGHVAIVKDVQNGYVDILEQNWSSTGQASLPIINGTISPRNGMSIIGWLRSVNSPLPPPPPPTMVKTASAVPSPSHHPADFSLHAGTQVAEYNSTTNSFTFQGTWVQPVGTIDWAAAGDFNGDGKADFAIHANNTIYTYLSTGNQLRLPRRVGTARRCLRLGLACRL